MNTLDAIAARRNIRKFKDTPIPDDMLQKILTAAIQAPSAWIPVSVTFFINQSRSSTR